VSPMRRGIAVRVHVHVGQIELEYIAHKQTNTQAHDIHHTNVKNCALYMKDRTAEIAAA